MIAVQPGPRMLPSGRGRLTSAAMATIAITGSAGGIGRATRARLEAGRSPGDRRRRARRRGDRRPLDAEGRAAMVEAVTDGCDGVLDGLVAGAGVMDDALAIQVNYFGAVATLEGLRPALARGTDASADRDQLELDRPPHPVCPKASSTPASPATRRGHASSPRAATRRGTRGRSSRWRAGSAATRSPTTGSVRASASTRSPPASSTRP